MAGIAAIGIPIAVSLHLASRQSLEAEFDQVLLLSRTVLRRSDETAEQVDAAFERMNKGRAGGADPCSASNLALMGEIDIGSSYLQAVGHAKGGRMLCSSLGRHGAGIPLGEIRYVSARGVAIRPSLELPLVPGKKFFVAEKDGNVAIIHHDLPIDVFSDKRNVSVGLFAPSNKMPMTGRSVFKPEWADALGNASESKFFDGEYVVAIRRSEKYDFAAYAATPAIYLQQGARGFAIVLVPLGILVSVILGFALVRIARQQMSLPSVMRAAFKRNEFFLVYQPVVDLRTGRWVGAEALIRWRRNDGVIIRPDVFIPAAEDNGLIQRITERVLQIVAAEVRHLLFRFPDLHIAINVSSTDLQSRRTIEMLRELTLKPGIAPGNILIEATERGFLKVDVAREIVRDIRAMGIGVAIDDFGTGYSSLSYLGTFEIDYLKIDKSFVDTVGTDAATSDVAVHIIEMAKTLNISMIAEGVEKESQAQFLRDRGVQYAQGWLFGKPMSMQDFLSQMHAQARAQPRAA